MLIPSTILYAEQYICVRDYAVGFDYNKTSKKWEKISFAPERKYLISNVDNRKNYHIKELGDDFLIFECYEGFNKSGSLICEDFFGVFRFNKTNGKYLRTYTYVYWNVSTDSIKKADEEQKNTPFIEIGVCSPF